MARYIDLENPMVYLGGYTPDGHSVYHVPSNTPTADVVEVVRCKDCQYWKTETIPSGIECEPGEYAHYCDMGGITRSADYCSYGDRK